MTEGFLDRKGMAKRLRGAHHGAEVEGFDTGFWLVSLSMFIRFFFDSSVDMAVLAHKRGAGRTIWSLTGHRLIVGQRLHASLNAGGRDFAVQLRCQLQINAMLMACRSIRPAARIQIAERPCAIEFLRWLLLAGPVQ
ncbi:unnamed protein product [Ostreobium quekettii]|uniref:Uncharacterized protein n=1 Tax=Ostreobium quekettii TaxID=121088 RepID=A0A8S1J256_9CHLO|nr:unnamed protein product [Ostreobium quekettii]